MTPHSIEMWANTNCQTCGTKFTGHTITSAQIAQLTIQHPTYGPSPTVHHITMDSMHNFNVGKYIPCGVPSLHFPSPLTPSQPNTQTPLYTPNSPYTPVSGAPSLVSTHVYSHSLTIHRPDKAASVRRLQKLVCSNLDYLALFKNLEDIFITNATFIYHAITI